jgi:hypothetical protein
MPSGVKRGKRLKDAGAAHCAEFAQIDSDTRIRRSTGRVDGVRELTILCY